MKYAHTKSVLRRTFDRIIVFYWNQQSDAVYLLAVTLGTSNKNATRIVQVQHYCGHQNQRKKNKT